MSILVTGATGFLGRAVAERLHLQGKSVLATGRNLKKGEALKKQGISFQAADLSRKEEVKGLFEGCEVVVHSAALSSPWGQYADFYDSNVLATEHLLDAALEAGVKRFVHISTPALYFKQASRLDVKENAELFKPSNHYIATKRLAEEKVDAALWRGLPVVTLRPRAIYGPKDTSILPRLIKRLESGRLPILGEGKNLVDLTYIDNAVDAVLLAISAAPHVVGRKYNITNGEAVVLWDEIAGICDLLDLKKPKRKLPVSVALGLARILETVYAVLPVHAEPPLTRYTVGLLAHSMTLDTSAAERDLKYKPRVATQEGLERFLVWWQIRAAKA